MVAEHTSASFQPKEHATIMATRMEEAALTIVPRVEPLRPARRLASDERKLLSAPEVTVSPSKNSMS